MLTPLVQKQINDRAGPRRHPPPQARQDLLREKEPSLQFTTPEQLGELAGYCSAAGDNIRGGVAWAMDWRLDAQDRSGR